MVCVCIVITTFVFKVNAQNEPLPVECGSIVESSWTSVIRENQYAIDLNLKDIVEVEVNPTTTGGIAYTIVVTNSLDLDIAFSRLGGEGTQNVQVEIPALDTYRIRVVARPGVIGTYTLSVGCTSFATGQVIVPIDDDALPIQPPVMNAPSYLNLAPISIDGAIGLPIVPGTAMPGVINQAESYAYTVEVNSAQVQLQVTRQSGNQNLGIVVVSPSGQVVFYGGLIASSDLMTMLNLSEQGTYTILVTAVPVTPPTAPEPTVFQVLWTAQ
jgi:hypothetical protein